MLKPICAPCQRFFRPKRNGFLFVEGMPVGQERAPPGTERPDLWQPYKLWQGDLWECQGCKTEIIVGTGYAPVSEQHQPAFASLIKESKLQVNDC